MSVRRSVRRSVGPSVCPSVCPSVPRYFQTPKIEVFELGKSSNVIIMLNNDKMSDDEVVASYVPPRYLFFYFLHEFLSLPITKNSRFHLHLNYDFVYLPSLSERVPTMRQAIITPIINVVLDRFTRYSL